MWFSLGKVAPGNIDVEEVEQFRIRSNIGRLHGNARQELSRVFGGRRGGEGQAEFFCIQDEGNGIRKNTKFAGINERNDLVLFFASIHERAFSG